MKLNEIATILNQTIVPNILGGETTITEDLSNINLIGTAIADLDGDALKDYTKSFALGIVKNFFQTRSYKNETYGLFIDSVEFGGAVQRVKARLLKAYDTPILNLVSYNTDPGAPDYNDGHFYGTETDSRVYTETNAFQIPYSIPTEMFKKSMTNAGDLQKLVALVESNAQNTLTNELNGLAKSVIRRLIVSCAGAREVKLITMYNTLHGLDGANAVTLANWENNTDFKLWCQSVIIRIKKRLTEWNRVTNDGTIETFTPEADIRTILLSEFGTNVDFTQSSVYHKELTDIGNYYTVESWQNSSADILPQISETSVHDEVVQKISASNTVTVKHIVGLVYDRLAAGITNRLDKTTSDYIAKGDFTTLFHHVAKDLWIDPRNSAIILTLS